MNLVPLSREPEHGEEMPHCLVYWVIFKVKRPGVNFKNLLLELVSSSKVLANCKFTESKVLGSQKSSHILGFILEHALLDAELNAFVWFFIKKNHCLFKHFSLIINAISSLKVDNEVFIDNNV